MNKMNKGINRLYEKGRSTKKWLKGEQIETLSQLAVGDILILINHKKQQESPIKVMGIHREFFDFCYVSAAGNVNKKDRLPQAKLLSDLGLNPCFLARSKVQAKHDDLVVMPKRKYVRKKAA